MASGTDPLADMQNLIGYQGLVGPNTYLPSWLQGKGPLVFGQDQPYSPQGQASPGFGQINTGVFGNRPPTDAYGVPIKGFVDYSNDQNALYAKQMADYNAKLAAQPAAVPGKTLNSLPANAGAGSGLGSGWDAIAAQMVPGVTPSTPYGAPGTNPAAIWQAAGATPQQMAGLFSQMSPTQMVGPGVSNGQPNPNYAMRMGQMMAGAGPYGQPAVAGGGAGPPPTPTNMRGAYLDALSNPGPIMPVGARAPAPGQTPTGSVSPSVMASFLAANAGSKTPFVTALRGLET